MTLQLYGPSTPTEPTPTEPTPTPTPTPSPGPSPPGFDQTLSIPAPRPGRVKPITSPVIPRGASVLGIELAFTGPLGQKAVTPAGAVGEPTNLTANEAQKLLRKIKLDRAVERAIEICWMFSDLDPDVLGRALEETERVYDDDLAYGSVTYILEAHARRFERCVEFVARGLLREPPQPGPTALSTRAQAAGTGCGVRALPLILRAKRGSRRVRLGLGSPRQARPRLKVRCAKTADGALTMTVRTRKRSARLREVVGRRLRIGVGRPRSGPRASG